MITLLKGGCIVRTTTEEFQDILKLHSNILIDIGTGDGKFPYIAAKNEPQTLCIGMDTHEEFMLPISKKSRRKISKGGLEGSNLIFVVSSIENTPSELFGSANSIFINFPWGSLLRGVITPLPQVLENIVNIAKPSAELTLKLNLSVFEDKEYINKIDLPFLDTDYVKNTLKETYEKHSIYINSYKILQKDPTPGTSWGNKLVYGSGQRKVLLVKCSIKL